MKPIIRKGDTTDHGGTVLDGFGLSNLNGRPASGVGHMVLCPKCQGTYPIVQGSSQYDLPPANRASRNLVKFVFGEDEHEEALFGRANHWLSEGSRGRYAGQGTVQEARVQ
ncbi:PAAR domain-containing protein [Burkholderia cenocepacia]|uniref:PAAR domain-containing protein n=1 Tax=Burkholderia cenocepacia TaxID=95486 RepID=UPI00097BD897|nr:PAAR domain-containing protein [Burkholderia cenocepacia]ONJ27328.1 hypothetical protein A8D82_04855 [Burkholderia cenocepacia]